MDTWNFKQTAIPDPALIPDTYLRQVLQAIRINQITLFKALSLATTATTSTQVTSTSANLPVRASGSVTITSNLITLSLPPDSNPADSASISLLANANKAAITQLADEHNKLLQDITSLLAIVKNMQGQQAEIIKRINQGY